MEPVAVPAVGAVPAIPQELRMTAVLAHLSGLAGYLLPLGGILVPILIWIVKSDTPLISAIAKQAVFLNVAVYLAIGASFVLWLTIVLGPLQLLIAGLLLLAAVVLPIVGALKASEGVYYRYPVVGVAP